MTSRGAQDDGAMLWKTARMRRTIMLAYDSPLGSMTLAAEDGEGLPVVTSRGAQDDGAML